jgi:hypothetical protein
MPAEKTTRRIQQGPGAEINKCSGKHVHLNMTVVSRCAGSNIYMTEQNDVSAVAIT